MGFGVPAARPLLPRRRAQPQPQVPHAGPDDGTSGVSLKHGLLQRSTARRPSPAPRASDTWGPKPVRQTPWRDRKRFALKARDKSSERNSHGRTRVGIEQRNQLIGSLVVLLCAAQFKLHQIENLTRYTGALNRTRKRIQIHSRALHVVEWKIDTPSSGIFADIAKNIGELERNACALCQQIGPLIGIPEYTNADQPHNGRNQIAIAIERIKLS